VKIISQEIDGGRWSLGASQTIFERTTLFGQRPVASAYLGGTVPPAGDDPEPEVPVGFPFEFGCVPELLMQGFLPLMLPPCAAVEFAVVEFGLVFALLLGLPAESPAVSGEGVAAEADGVAVAGQGVAVPGMVFVPAGGFCWF
jgi:hypothetical protein